MTESDTPCESTSGTGEPTESLIEGSAVLTAIRTFGIWLGAAVRGSYLYRWLTKGPEPAVIVIDLRETYVLGPVLGVLDRLTDWLAPYWERSLLKRGTDSFVTLGQEAADTRIGRVVAKLLSPPDPPNGK